MFNAMIEVLKANPRKIVFTEGHDARILEATSRLVEGGFLTPILIGDVEVVKANAAKGGFNIQGVEILDPKTYAGMDEMVAKMVELRKGKMSPEECRAALMKGNYFGTMLVKMGYADSLLGGATYSTADTVRPALQIIKTTPGITCVSGAMLLLTHAPEYGQNGVLVMGDVAVTPVPDADQLAQIAVCTARTARAVAGLDPKVAMLSFSTKGSAKHEVVDKVVEALRKAKDLAPDIAIDGELQADAALVPSVGASKAPGSAIAGHANVLVVPSLEVGNISYKLVQRLGHADAIGPVLQGIARPVNDLSRGCSIEDVYRMIAITANQAIAAKQ